VHESFGSNVPAFQASSLFVVCNHALTRVAIDCRRFAPLFFARSAGVGALRRRRGPTLPLQRNQRRRFAPRFFAHSVEAQGCKHLPDQPRRGGSE